MTPIDLSPVQGNREPLGTRSLGPPASRTRFSESLQAAMGTPNAVRFSAHAEQRLLERRIHLSASDLRQIESAVDKASAKGSKESLVIMDKAALIVSVPNRTVITALPSDELNDAVFTHIDSAVFLGQPTAPKSGLTAPYL
ncbi:MAG: hypothetical protein AMXMBFR84_07760 [Candidatus Hydrogenedentota bacterium]